MTPPSATVMADSKEGKDCIGSISVTKKEEDDKENGTQPRQRRRRRVAIFCATWNIGREEWDFEGIRTKGMGGSEEAVVYMAQELAKLDLVVHVYGYPPSDSPCLQSHLNPRMFPAAAFFLRRPHPTSLLSDRVNKGNVGSSIVAIEETKEEEDQLYDSVVVWRDVHVLPRVAAYAKKVMFWSHDSSPTEAPLLAASIRKTPNFGHAMFLSRFHARNWISSLSSDQHIPFLITSNGINVKQFSDCDALLRKPFRCIYASNYRQGLLTVLDNWKTLKDKYTALTLDIYYGWGTLSAPDPMILMKLIELAHPMWGVRERGRIDHEQLAREFSTSDLWLYPANVAESFCLTATKAAAGGAIPVVVATGAMEDTVLGGYVCTKQDEFLPLFDRAAREQGTKEKLRESLKQTARAKFAWSRVAIQWISCIF